MTHGPSPAHHLFLYGLQAKNGFYLLSGLKQQKRVIFHNTWKFCEIQILLSVDRVLLEHSPSCSFTYCLWLLSCSDGVGVVAAETVWPAKWKIFTSGPLQRKFASVVLSCMTTQPPNTSPSPTLGFSGLFPHSSLSDLCKAQIRSLLFFVIILRAISLQLQ